MSAGDLPAVGALARPIKYLRWQESPTQQPQSCRCRLVSENNSAKGTMHQHVPKLQGGTGTGGGSGTGSEYTHWAPRLLVP